MAKADIKKMQKAKSEKEQLMIWKEIYYLKRFYHI